MERRGIVLHEKAQPNSSSSLNMSTVPSIIAGGATWGHNVNDDEAQRQMASLKAIGVREIDTAALYPFSKPTMSEQIIGNSRFGQDGFLIDTKIMWFNGGKGTLTKDNIPKSVDESLERLGLEKVNVLYAIGPDHETPLEEQAAAFDGVYRQGKFATLGLSNFSPEMLEKYVEIAQKNGYVKPSVYQGQYNLICRTYEATLLPFLRKHDIAFAAFSPLAQGMLTSKLTFAENQDEDLKGTRFDTAKDNMYGLNARRWYDKPSFHDAIRKMKSACEPYGLDTTDAAMRWIVNHSILDGTRGDGIIIGPRNKEQCDKYIQGIQGGPLPEELVKTLNGLWEGVSDDAASILEY
ncbi:Aldo/keto reductase [Xylaria acuta]|nr:Aldo/keto reductase [Xylaria acuta]